MLEKGNFINNRYEIINPVGAGGMSDVYKAKDHKLNRNVAIKVLKSEYSKDKNFVSKFRVEAQSAASLIHPNIVNVYDVGEDDGLYYIVMELIEGITLKKYIEKKGKLSFRETISIAIQIANGIECAHNNQIVHRDIKPQNILISREGKVKVTDFGIARAASANTINGNAMGSVHYISPEQAGGQYVDEKSDIYSLGITMFEMYTGRVPFDGESTVSIALKHIQSNVPSVREYVPTVPVSIEKIILKCTQNKADRRYPKISLLISDLKRALAEPNVDFVQLDTSNIGGSTVMITDDEINQIRKSSSDNRKDTVEDTLDDENDIDKLNPKMDRIVSVGGIIIGIIALLIATVVATLFISDNNFDFAKKAETVEVSTVPSDKTIVPNVLGQTLDDAEQLLHKNYLGYKYDSNYVYSDIYPKDTIVSQSIDSGKMVDRNETVTLVVSKGAKKITVPSGIVNSSLETAKDTIKKAGLKTEVVYEYSDRSIDVVISCSPSERASVSKNSIVTLKVSRGRTVKDNQSVYTVPNLVGMEQGKAQAKISSSGFSIGAVREVYDEKIEKGIVIRQTLKAGTSIPSGATIGLVVSKGPENPEEYKATYTFALEDLVDSDGNPITEGVVSVAVDEVLQKVDKKHSDVSKWDGDYTMDLTSETKGKATIELFVNGKSVKKDTVKFK